MASREDDFLNSEDVGEVIADADGVDPMSDGDDDDDNVAGAKLLFFFRFLTYSFCSEEEIQELDASDVDYIDDSILEFSEHHESVYAVAIHPNNQLVLSGGGDDKAYLWNIETGETLFEITAHSDSIVSVGFSTDGQYGATGGMDGKVVVFKTTSKEIVASLDGPNEVIWIDWHPRGPVLLAGAKDGSIWMWQIPSGNCMNVFSGHLDSVTCGGFTPDGKMVVSGSEDGSLIIWDPKTAAVIQKFTADDRRFLANPITSLAINSESSLLVVGSSEGQSRLVHIGNGKILASFDNHTESIESVGFSKTLPLVATSSVDGTICIWDLATLRLRHTLRHDDAVTKILWHSTMPYLFSTSLDKKVRLWDARTGECKKKFQGHSDTVLDLATVTEGVKVVSVSDDQTALVFAYTE
ncbi:hypothetical protein HK096_010207 [Nowakowskiella sp. JEL0078]|nr:hypothetical protein HK096_010207 [Nowakowskiella sp. JEL0078]